MHTSMRSFFARGLHWDSLVCTENSLSKSPMRTSESSLVNKTGINVIIDVEMWKSSSSKSFCSICEGLSTSSVTRYWRCCTGPWHVFVRSYNTNVGQLHTSVLESIVVRAQDRVRALHGVETHFFPLSCAVKGASVTNCSAASLEASLFLWVWAVRSGIVALCDELEILRCFVSGRCHFAHRFVTFFYVSVVAPAAELVAVFFSHPAIQWWSAPYAETCSW